MENAVKNFVTIAKNVIKEIRTQSKEFCEVEQVYLSETTRKVQVMTFIVKKDLPTISQDYSVRIGAILEGYPQLKFRIYGYSYARRELAKANLYFIKNCTFGKLLYDRGNLKRFESQGKNENVVLLKNATSRFKKEIERINSFTEGIIFYRKRKEWAGAAFLIHQKIEWLYRCLEIFAMGKPLICHKIKNHLVYAHPFIYGAGPIFNIKRRVELQLLEVLDRAYTESRYSSAFDITKKEIKALQERADLMENQVKEIFEFGLDDCHKLLANEKGTYRDEFSKIKEKISVKMEENDVEILKKIILQELNAVKILSFGKRAGFRERQSLAGISETLLFQHYDLLIITANGGDIAPIKISQQISRSTEGKISATIIITSLKKVKKALQKRNVFLYRVLEEGVQLYSDPNHTFESPLPSISPAEQLEIIQRDFFYRQHRANCFLAAAGEVAGDDDATEISLQYLALQQICLGAIYVMLGLRPDCLKLEYLLDLCSNFSNAPDSHFPRFSKEDQRLLKKLITSLNEVRFRTSDRHSLVDVDTLFSRSEKFLNEMKLISQKRIEEMKIKQQNHEI